MPLKTFMTSAPDIAEPQESAWQAAVRMRQRAVGSLVIVNDDYAAVGIITDRDLVERVMAAGKDPVTTRLADVMTQGPVTIVDTAELSEAVALMRKHGVRRLPVVNEIDKVCGLISLDDVIALLAGECENIAQLIKGEMPRGICEATTSRWD